MLVLNRRKGERIVIREGIVVTVLGVEGGRVKLGIEAPRHVTVTRQEVLDREGAPLPVPPVAALTHVAH